MEKLYFQMIKESKVVPNYLHGYSFSQSTR